jgi:sulfite exporter TauE/SafE
VHCEGMCGGIVGAVSMTLQKPAEGRSKTGVLMLAYNTGRIASYTVAGLLMGGLGFMLASFMPVQLAQQLLLLVAGVFMVLLGFYLTGWWTIVRLLEKPGVVLWKKIEPYGRRLLPVRTLKQSFLLGLLWGWLPCGLVYSVLIWSVGSGSALQGGMMMLAFGLGTLPNLLAMGVLASRFAGFMHKPWVRKLAGLMVIALGLLNLLGLAAIYLLPDQA